MKISCDVDTIHFKGDFEDTLKTPCNFWGDMGFGNLEIHLKKKIWDWIFNCPSDEVGILAGRGIALQIGSAPIREESKFENLIPGYKEMEEEDRQKVQRIVIAAQKAGEKIPFDKLRPFQKQPKLEEFKKPKEEKN